MKADAVCICFVTKHHYTALPLFPFSLFYILLFSVNIVNVNAAKSSKGLDNLSVNIYIAGFHVTSLNFRLQNY